jgi:hypothetical protein
MSCPRGYIKAYSRETSTESGKIVKVKSNCIRALSQSGQKRTSIDRAIIGRKKREHLQARQKFGTPKCSSGEIVREGYKRSSYKKKSGSIIPKKWVSPSCIKSRTGRPKGEQLFILEKNVLSKYGYENIENLSINQRHESLKKALDNKIKPLSIYRRLIALATLNKNLNPLLYDIFIADTEWLKTTEEYINRDSEKVSTEEPKRGSKRWSKRGSKRESKRQPIY